MDISCDSTSILTELNSIFKEPNSNYKNQLKSSYTVISETSLDLNRENQTEDIQNNTQENNYDETFDSDSSSKDRSSTTSPSKLTESVLVSVLIIFLK